MPDDEKLSAEALAFSYLLRGRGWSKRELASALGLADEKSLTRYEHGGRALSRELLDKLIAPLGLPREAPDLLIWAHHLIFQEPAAEELAGPLALTAEERGRIQRTLLVAEWALAADLHRTLTRWKRERKAEAARREAEALAEVLKSASAEDRRRLLAVFPEYRSWAVAERLAHDSVRAAAHRVDEARALAELALEVARQVPGEAQRARTEGYCTGFLANVLRVATDFDLASALFERGWALWREGQAAASLPLAEWRLLDLEASLRREQHRFAEARERLDEALAACDGGALAVGKLLVAKATVAQQQGDHAGALAALEEATPAVEGSGDPNLVFALRFNTVINQVYLERYAAAAARLPAVRELAIEQGRELHLIRLLWLSSKLAAGQGKAEEAKAGLEQVIQEFTGLKLAYEAALAGLDQAVLSLKEGRTAEVKALAEAMRWIFKAKRITREALEALRLFCDAARQETATIELVRQVIAKMEEAQRSAPPG
jgi:transcriptional regulator with XRE-family HTH domain